jgi:hypothetical protein
MLLMLMFQLHVVADDDDVTLAPCYETMMILMMRKTFDDIIDVPVSVPNADDDAALSFS